MKIVIIILGTILGALAVWLITHLVRYLWARSQFTDQLIRAREQNEIFNWGAKVVQTIEEEYRNSDLEKKVKSRRKFDQALSRLNDIIMLNGIDPRQYNTEGVITYSVHKLHKEEVNQNGKSNRPIS